MHQVSQSRICLIDNIGPKINVNSILKMFSNEREMLIWVDSEKELGTTTLMLD